MEEENFNQILALVGSKGYYQKRLVWTFLLTTSLMMAWIQNTPIFLASVPDHWCHVEGQPLSVSDEDWKNLTIPWVKDQNGGQYSKCFQYKIPKGGSNRSVEILEDHLNISACQNGWNYDKTWYSETVTSMNNWVCQDSYKSATWLSVGEIGRIVGTLIFTRLSDIFGRKIILLVISSIFACSNLLRLVFIGGWSSYLMNFLAKMGFSSGLYICFVLVGEQVDGSWRNGINALKDVATMAGLCSLPFFAWLTRDWRLLSIVTTTPYIFFLPFWFFVAKSPCWLASRSKTSEAYENLCRIAKINKKKPPDDLRETLQRYIVLKQRNSKKQGNLLDIFQSRILCKYVILSGLNQIVMSLSYNTFNYNVNNMSGNEFLNFFYLGLIEGPSALVSFVACQNLGRKWCQIMFYLCNIFTMGLVVFVFSLEGNGAIVCVILAKSFITGASYTGFLLNTEMFPTSHRTTLIGFITTVASLTVTSVPYITYSAIIWARLPYVLLALLSMIGATVTLFLPETINHPLPQTISDAELFFKSQRFWSYFGNPCRRNGPIFFFQSFLKKNTVDVQETESLLKKDCNYESKTYDS